MPRQVTFAVAGRTENRTDLDAEGALVALRRLAPYWSPSHRGVGPAVFSRRPGGLARPVLDDHSWYYCWWAALQD